MWPEVLWHLGGTSDHIVVIIPRITLGYYQTYVNIIVNLTVTTEIRTNIIDFNVSIYQVNKISSDSSLHGHAFML